MRQAKHGLLIENPHIRHGRAQPLPKNVWRWYDALFMLIGTFAGLFGAPLLVTVLVGDGAPEAAVNLLQWFAQFAVMVMVVGALAIISRVDLRDIGWRPSHGMWITQALAVVVVLLVIRMMVLFAVLPLIVPFLPVPQDAPIVEQEQVVDPLAPNQTVVIDLALILLISGVAPLVEETLFRGVLHHWLRNHMGFWPAAWISGLTFGAIHLNIPQFVTATILGVAASWLYERSGSLVPAITLHAVNNFLAQGLSYVFLFIGLQLGV